MRHTARSTLALAALAVGSVGMAAAAQAAQDHKVWLCHGTASKSNPYVLIHVAESALGGHLGEGTDPGHGQNNHPDFLLEDAPDCGDTGGEGGGGGGGGGE